MPDPVKAPPEERVDELITEITGKMWADFDLDDNQEVRNDRVITFFIREIAYLKAQLEML